MKIARLNENFLFEDIASVKKQYSHIPEEEFDKIIRLDPTFNENRDSVGKYGKWLLGMYKKDNPLRYNPFNVEKLLTDYNKFKNDRKYKIEKDINKFKDLGDMQTAVNNVEEAELSDRQKTRERQKNKDYDLVYQDDDWAIFVPNTWEADVNLGKGTKWCTADSREEHGKHYYGEYLQQGGKYYVVINKHDKSDKYQFHFESRQFMNAKDNPISLSEFMSDNESMQEFFQKEGYNIEDYMAEIDWEEIVRDIISEGGEVIEENIASSQIRYPSWLLQMSEDWFPYLQWIEILNGSYELEDIIEAMYPQEDEICWTMLDLLDSMHLKLPNEFLETTNFADYHVVDLNTKGKELLFKAFCQHILDYSTNYYLAEIVGSEQISEDIYINENDFYFKGLISTLSDSVEYYFPDYGDPDIFNARDIEEYLAENILDTCYMDFGSNSQIHYEPLSTQFMVWACGKQAPFTSGNRLNYSEIVYEFFNKDKIKYMLEAIREIASEKFDFIQVPE